MVKAKKKTKGSEFTMTRYERKELFMQGVLDLVEIDYEYLFASQVNICPCQQNLIMTSNLS